MKAWIKSQQSPLLEKLMAWSAINSGSRNLAGLAELRESVYQQFSMLADTSQVIELPDLSQLDDRGELRTLPQAPILHFAKRPEAPVQILLCGHMDTVFPADSDFQLPKIKDGQILHGPGVADMKGGLLVMWLALAAWERNPAAQRLGWQVVINSDEETGSLASSHFLKNIARSAHVGLVYEPALADGTLAGARKGSGNFSLLVRGRSAHAGRDFEQGRNAIAALASAMNELHLYNNIATGLTINLGRISGGGATNKVADWALCHFNVRVKDASTMQSVNDQLKAVTARINARDGFQAELHGGFHRPPKEIDASGLTLFKWLKECGDELGLSINMQATGGCCDGNNLAAAGLPNIDTLGVRGGEIHTEKEFMLIESLSERATLSAMLLEKLANHHDTLLELRGLQ